jgi:hypothetical protein
VFSFITDSSYFLRFSELYPKNQLVPCSKHTPSQL